LYPSSNIRERKSRRMRWVGHGACMGEIRNAYRTLEEDLKRADYLRDKDINGRIILKWVARRCGSIHLDSVVSLFFFFVILSSE
jgi:hypothetical protein